MLDLLPVVQDEAKGMKEQGSRTFIRCWVLKA